nr:MAG TPA: RecT protein [Caudoviricetes sp.]
MIMNNKQSLANLKYQEIAKLNTMPFANFMSQSVIQNRIAKTIGSDRGQRFITAIVSAVNNNQDLAKCTNNSIYSGALLGESLNLSPSPQLGHYYLVPFNVKKQDINGKDYWESQAQFQLGYKGYLQLAIRSGQYKKINVLAIKEGELISYNPLDEEIQVKLIEDEETRENAKTIGYYAMFEYSNGFKKTLYWSRKKMQAHAEKYSQGYRSDLKKGTSYTFWSKDFDGMAYKTMLRQLISKWGIMSIDLQNAIEKDMGIIQEDGNVDYPDNQLSVPEANITEIDSEKDNNVSENQNPYSDKKEQVSLDDEKSDIKQVKIDDLLNN